MTESRLATPRDLWLAVDALLNPSRVRLPRDPDLPIEWVTIPSLWVQLLDAADTLTGQAAAGARSRPPCSTRALSLQVEIESKVRWACRERRIRLAFDLARDLRQLVSAVTRDHDPSVITASCRQVGAWAGRIRTILDPRREARLHGATCRVCGLDTITAWDDAGEEIRQPALAIHSEDGVIQDLECGYCGSVLTGDDLTAIMYAALKRPVVLQNITEAIQ